MDTGLQRPDARVNKWCGTLAITARRDIHALQSRERNRQTPMPRSFRISRLKPKRLWIVFNKSTTGTAYGHENSMYPYIR